MLTLANVIIIYWERFRYKQLLKELAVDLTSDEVSQMLFLLRGHVKGKQIRTVEQPDATKLLGKLDELDCIGINNLNLLAELFELIGCDGLKKKVVKKQHHICQVSIHEVNEFMRSLWRFGKKIDSEDLNNAIYNLGWCQENITNTCQLFEKAFEKKRLAEDNKDSIRTFAERAKLTGKLQVAQNHTSEENPSTRDHMEPEEKRPPWTPTQVQPVNNCSPYMEPYYRGGNPKDDNGSQNEASPEIKSGDINEDPKDIRKVPNTGQSIGIKTLTLGEDLAKQSSTSDGNRREGHNSSDAQRSDRSHEDHLLESQDTVYSKFQTIRKQTVFIPNNPRSNQIIKLSVNKMKKHIGKMIGGGNFGKVYEANEFKEVNFKCVIKEIEFTDEASQKSYDREVESGRILHPFINPIIACAESPLDGTKKGFFYLMFPFMENTDLRHNIDLENQQKKLSPLEPNCIIWTRSIYQICQAMDYLHNPIPSVRGPIFHRDLKSRNIFLDENFNVRIGDFGIAVQAKLNATHATETTKPYTHGYHPPSRWSSHSEYKASYDVFSVGVVILEILTGKEADLTQEKASSKKVYLYQLYSKTRGFIHLKGDIKDRFNKVKQNAENTSEASKDQEEEGKKLETSNPAVWSSSKHRDNLATIALKAVTLDDNERSKVNLFQSLENLKTCAEYKECLLRLQTKEVEDVKTLLEEFNMKKQPLESNLQELTTEEKEYKQKLEKILEEETIKKELQEEDLEDYHLRGNGCYRKPEQFDRCMSCYVNPPANLSLQGACADSESPCKLFCVPCLANNHINPLVCPEHGKTRPPFGDHVYGVFVAGNDIKGIKMGQRFYSPKEVAEIFIRDVDNIVKVLTAKYPCILGVDSAHLSIVKPENPGVEMQMEKSIRTSFTQISDMIKIELEKNKLDRIPGSLFIFYFSGHCDERDGLMLGSESERIKATTEWIKDMLHNDLGVENVLVILDCCNADSQDFADTGGSFKEGRNTKVRIFHLASCDIGQTIKFDDQGSHFTSIFCQGLKGFKRKVSEDGTVYCDKCGGPFQFCDHCEKEIMKAGEQNQGKDLQGFNSREPDDTAECYQCKARKQTYLNIKVPCMEFHDKCSKTQFVAVSSLQEFVQEHFKLYGYNYDTVANTQKNADKMILTYYNPYKPCITIYLTDSKNSDKSGQKAYIFSMDCYKQDIGLIKQDIIRYAEIEKVQCDILTFYQSYGKTAEECSPLVAIYCKDDNYKDNELTTLDCIYNVYTIARDVEARVRENVKRLSPKCPVMIRAITKGMVERSQNNWSNGLLDITENSIQIQVANISKAEELIMHMRDKTEGTNEFRDLMKKLSDTLRNIEQEDIQGNFLEFHLFNEFSVVEIK